VITDAPSIVSGTASFIAQLSTERSQLDEKAIAALCKINVVRTGRLRAKPKARSVRRLGNSTWIVGVNEITRDPTEREQKHIDRANAVTIHSHEGLHSKVILLGKHAVVGGVQPMQDAREPAARCDPCPRSTPIWKLKASLKCRSCRKGRYAPPVHMIRLTETQEIAPYPWVHPDEER
jgi:hypothetical protein